jgi:hypothetical protein
MQQHFIFYFLVQAAENLRSSEITVFIVASNV